MTSSANNDNIRTGMQVHICHLQNVLHCMCHLFGYPGSVARHRLVGAMGLNSCVVCTCVIVCVCVCEHVHMRLRVRVYLFASARVHTSASVSNDLSFNDGEGKFSQKGPRIT